MAPAVKSKCEVVDKIKNQHILCILYNKMKLHTFIEFACHRPEVKIYRCQVDRLHNNNNKNIHTGLF
jgi:hypothetical protein